MILIYLLFMLFILEGLRQIQDTHSNYVFKFPVFSLFFPCPIAKFPCDNLHDL